LLRPLAGLIIEASRQSQVWVTTHSRELAQAVVEGGGTRPIELALVEGETVIAEQFDE
jgi:predicted ATPase